jgi:autotransporter translocation and assembly factor TamB
MKLRNIFTPIMMLVALSVILSSCTEMANKFAEKVAKEALDFEYEDSAKWGTITEQELSFPAFNSIKTKGKVCIVLSQDSISAVRVRANKKCIEAYKFDVRKDELRIECKGFKGQVDRNTPPVTFFIAVPNLKELEITGAGKLEVIGTMVQEEPLEIEINGVGEVNIDTLSVVSLNVELNGVADCSFTNVTAQGDIEIEVNGTGDINANVFCQKLEVELNGAGKAALSGECKNFVCDENGSSKVDFSNLKR